MMKKMELLFMINTDVVEKNNSTHFIYPNKNINDTGSSELKYGRVVKVQCPYAFEPHARQPNVFLKDIWKAHIDIITEMVIRPGKCFEGHRNKSSVGKISINVFNTYPNENNMDEFRF